MRAPWFAYFLIAVVGFGCADRTPEAAESQAVQADTKDQAIRHRVDYSAGAESHQRLPMLVLIHGFGGTPDKMYQSFGSVDVPARVVSLRGKSGKRRGFFWFPVDVENPDIPGLSRDLLSTGQHVAEELRSLTTRFPTHGLPVVLGFSQGAMIALELGVHHSDNIGASVIVAGYYPPPLYSGESFSPSTKPLVAIHGTADEVLPIEHMRTALQVLALSDVKIEFHEYEGMKHSVDSEAHRFAMGVLNNELRRQSQSGQSGHP